MNICITLSARKLGKVCRNHFNPGHVFDSTKKMAEVETMNDDEKHMIRIDFFSGKHALGKARFPDDLVER